MKLLIPLLTVALFLWLASASQQDGAYSQSDIDAVTRLSLAKLTLQQRQAAVLQEMFNIKDEEIGRAVRLW